MSRPSSLRPCARQNVVILDNLASHKSAKAEASPTGDGAPEALLPAALQPRSQSDGMALAKLKAHLRGIRHRPWMPYGRPSVTSALSTPRKNAGTSSSTPDMHPINGSMLGASIGFGSGTVSEEYGRRRLTSVRRQDAEVEALDERIAGILQELNRDPVPAMAKLHGGAAQLGRHVSWRGGAPGCSCRAGDCASACIGTDRPSFGIRDRRHHPEVRPRSNLGHLTLAEFTAKPSKGQRVPRSRRAGTPSRRLPAGRLLHPSSGESKTKRCRFSRDDGGPTIGRPARLPTLDDDEI